MNDIVHCGCERIKYALDSAKEDKQAAFIGFVTAGYPTSEDTPSILLAMQHGGAHIIELGIPYTDPQADGSTIQETNQISISNGTSTISNCLTMLSQARALGLTCSVILMGYYNPFYQYGLNQLFIDSLQAGVDGFIVVDLPPEEAFEMATLCHTYGLSNIPLIAPTCSDDRIEAIVQTASTFLYCVSVTGVSGVRNDLPVDLEEFLSRVRSKTELPLAVGFGISTVNMVRRIANFSDAIVVGSAILKTIEAAGAYSSTDIRVRAVEKLITNLCSGLYQREHIKNQTTILKSASISLSTKTMNLHERQQCTRFGNFGGQFIPETLWEAFREIEEVYFTIKNDPNFLAELDQYRRDFVGGPTPLHLASRLTALAEGAKIWLKREDLAHTGAHKINNAIGQAILAKRIGKTRIISETGAGQHGVATATVCAMLGLKCIVYMGAVDCERQKLNVFRMNMLGAKVVPVRKGQQTLKDAINEAMRDWVTNVRTTHYLIGSVVGPYPFPLMVRDFQSVIGTELRVQMLEKAGKLPDAIVACVGGGSNAMGAFYPFIKDETVQLHGVEAAGYGLDTSQGHCATLTRGKPGILQGALTYVIQESSGQTLNTHSISAGMDYPGVGPEHAYLKDIGRATYSAVTDDQCLEGFQYMCEYEGIIPALETSHAIYYAINLAKYLKGDKDIVINMSGRGDKDMPQVAKIMKFEL